MTSDNGNGSGRGKRRRRRRRRYPPRWKIDKARGAELRAMTILSRRSEKKWLKHWA
jgi:hypothetical protein